VITITPVNGFNAYVSLSCNGLPAYATCTFTPSYMQATCTPESDGSESCPSVLSTMQIQTYAPSAKTSLRSETPDSGLPKYAAVFPALLTLAGFGARKKRALFNVVLVVSLFAGALCLTACNVRYNYLNHGPTSNTGTQTGTYAVDIDAVSTTGSEITKPLTPVQLSVVITGAS
jgi:hypothetical protein